MSFTQINWLHMLGKALLLVESVEIPYANIVRVSYGRWCLLYSALNCNDLILELSGMDEKTVKLECVNNAEQVVNTIQGFIRKVLQTQQAQFTRNYHIGDIVERI